MQWAAAQSCPYLHNLGCGGSGLCGLMLWVGLFQRKCWSGFQHATGHRESTMGTCKQVGYQGEGTRMMQ